MGEEPEGEESGWQQDGGRELPNLKVRLQVSAFVQLEFEFNFLMKLS